MKSPGLIALCSSDWRKASTKKIVEPVSGKQVMGERGDDSDHDAMKVSIPAEGLTSSPATQQPDERTLIAVMRSAANDYLFGKEGPQRRDAVFEGDPLYRALISALRPYLMRESDGL